MNIYFYQNKLYLIKRAGSRAILEEVNPDGTDRKEVGDVGIANNNNTSNRMAFVAMMCMYMMQMKQNMLKMKVILCVCIRCL